MTRQLDVSMTRKTTARWFWFRLHRELTDTVVRNSIITLHQLRSIP
jgi:hypothetical protein